MRLSTLVQAVKTAVRLFLMVMIIGSFSTQQAPLKTQPATVIASLAWNPEGTILAVAGSLNGHRALWLVDNNGLLIQQFDTPLAALGISWHPDGSQIATFGSGGYTIRDADTGDVLVTFLQQGSSSDDFTHWNPADFSQMATVGQDLVYLRDANTGEVQATLDGPGGLPDSVLSVGWSLDDTTLYTVSTDDLIRVWDVDSAALVNEIPLSYGVSAFAMSPDATLLGIGGADGQVRIHDAATGASLPAYANLPILASQNLWHVIWRPDGKQIAGADREGIRVWDVETGELLTTLPYRTDFPAGEAMAYHPDGFLTYPDTTGDILFAPIIDSDSD